MSALCSDDPAANRRWRVRNPNRFDIFFTWELLASPANQHGDGIAPPAINGVPGEVILTTSTERWVAAMQVNSVSRSNFALNLGLPCDLPPWLEP